MDDRRATRVHRPTGISKPPVVRFLCRTACLCLTISLLPAPYVAQTLARPGWAGSGLNGEPWWRSAVFYRVHPRTFQDSDADGVGDLPGLTSRLDYLQTLGVDALVLVAEPAGPKSTASPGSKAKAAPASKRLPFSVLDEPGFDDLISEASRRHLRVVLTQPLLGDTNLLLARARSALTRGAAGLELSPPETGAPADAPFALGELRSLAGSFPGERVVLSGLDAPPTAAAFRSVRSVSRSGALRLSASEAPELEVLAIPPQAPGSPESPLPLRTLVAAAESLPPGTAALFRSESSLSAPAGGASPVLPLPAAEFLAVRLLTLRGALSFDAGQELGLTSAAGTAAEGVVASAPPPLMQWTPSNLTPPTVKIEPNPAPTPVPTRSDVYGAYRPYVPVKPKAIALPGAPTPPPAPDSLPGFTSGSLPFRPPAALDTAERNVAMEDGDPHSLLNLYRRLIALHHGHATLRTGSTTVLDTALEGALVWVRRAPAGARTVASVIVACNLSGSPLSLSLDPGLARAHIRPGLLRPLLGGAAVTYGPQSTAHLSLPAHAVYVGEIYHH